MEHSKAKASAVDTGQVLPKLHHDLSQFPVLPHSRFESSPNLRNSRVADPTEILANFSDEFWRSRRSEGRDLLREELRGKKKMFLRSFPPGVT